MHYCSGDPRREFVAAPKPRPKSNASAPPQPGRAEREFLADVGRLVRLGRAKRGITRRKLAQDSGISERYLAQIEGGQGNPSVIVLKAIAEAIDVAIIELLPRTERAHRRVERHP